METLEDKLRSAPAEDFPGDRKADYIRYYESAREFLEPIQKAAGAGAMSAEIKAKIKDNLPVKAEEILHLNNHGPEHIDCVIKRCSCLLAETLKDHYYDIDNKNKGCDINGYEAYVLLVAINLHDAGNIEGRKDHEKRVFGFIRDMDKLLGTDSAEKNLIGKIAAVHGGRINGSKDTIKTLLEGQHILGKPLDCRFLAALVRFGDELADDSTRASRFMLEKNILSEESEVFHQYSISLASVRITKSELSLNYYVDHETALRKFKKQTEQVYLIDEIFSRLLKMHLERIYCLRYLRHRLEIGPIRFQLEVFNSNDPFSTPQLVSGTLQETGFPDDPRKGIHEICPELGELDGLAISQKIKRIKQYHGTT